MKLELKHLAGYLPYGMKYEWSNSIYYYEHCSTRDFDYENSKPILRPLSYLTRFELEKAGFMYYIDYLTYENQGVEWTLRAPYDMVVYLLSQHYDIYGLIEAGLAIDINTLNK